MPAAANPILNPLLYGANAEERIVAIQPHGDDAMRIYLRARSGVVSRDTAFYPFFFLSDPSYLKNFPGKHWIRELAGDNFFKYLCVFPNWPVMWDAVRMVIAAFNERTGSKIGQYIELPVLYLRPEPVTQFLLQSGMTQFKGMEFEHLHRMQLDIETYTKSGQALSNANRPEDRIIIITLSDNRGWEKILDIRGRTEREILLEAVDIITGLDPDVIEGHNIYNFDLPYILRRCEMFGIDFAIGRDGSTPRSYESRMAFAERAVDYVAYEIAGRHIIDTWLLVQAFDVSKRSLESYGLKYAARYFGFARPDRTYIEGKKISWHWDNDPESLLRYASDDVFETRMLSEYLSPSQFYMARIVPMSYGAIARSGSSSKIETLIMREYIRQKHSIPKPQVGMQTSGGYTGVYYTGLMGPIIHSDVESLYPSIMVTDGIAPKSDRLNVFHSVLQMLTKMRLDTKRTMRSAKNPSDKSRLDAMQASYKILINSFYGYLGYARAIFNDYSEADRVTQTGQRILRGLIATTLERGGIVVEVDTDGIYFVPPAGMTTEEKETAFVAGLSDTLPAGINLGIDGRYKQILSYKKKNYALEDYQGNIRIKGSSLISRSMERFGRRYIEGCIRALLARDIPGLHALYTDQYHRIVDHRLSIEDIAKTESLKIERMGYLAKINADERNRSASYEAAIRAGMEWRVGERVSYYITGSDPNGRGFENCRLADQWDPNFPDENAGYYLRRLDEFSSKFEPFFTPQAFRSIFSMEDLFGFDPSGITIQTQPVKRADEEGSEENEENG